MKRNPPVITVIGAASTTFGPKVLRDVVNHPQIDGATLRLMDVDAERLEIYNRLAQLLVGRLAHSVTVECFTDRRAALTGSDYVIVSVERNRHELWQQDYHVPLAEGMQQVYAEIGGPGGLFHTLRQVPLHLEIARDAAELCPRAMFMIASNPLNRLCLAVQRHTDVKQVVGLCHGVEITLQKLAREVFDDLSMDQLEGTAAGTNHLVWLLDLRHAETGEDLYPKLCEKLIGLDPHFEPLSRKLLEIFAFYPAPGDKHIGEYLPFAWDLVKHTGPNPAKAQRPRDRWQRLQAAADGRDDAGLAELMGPRTWRDTLAFPIIAAIQSNVRHRMPALNLLNDGSIANLPASVFVETPAVVDAAGIRPERVGPLPPALAAFNRRDIEQTELVVEAAVTGNRSRLLQAMLLDPTLNSIHAAERTLDRLLTMQAKYLPQFQ